MRHSGAKEKLPGGRALINDPGDHFSEQTGCRGGLETGDKAIVRAIVRASFETKQNESNNSRSHSRYAL